MSKICPFFNYDASPKNLFYFSIFSVISQFAEIFSHHHQLTIEDYVTHVR